MTEHANTQLEAAQQPSEKDHPAAEAPPPRRSDREPEREAASHPQYDSFMRIIRR